VRSRPTRRDWCKRRSARVPSESVSAVRIESHRHASTVGTRRPVSTWASSRMATDVRSGPSTRELRSVARWSDRPVRESSITKRKIDRAHNSHSWNASRDIGKINWKSCRFLSAFHDDYIPITNEIENKRIVSESQRQPRIDTIDGHHEQNANDTPLQLRLSIVSAWMKQKRSKNNSVRCLIEYETICVEQLFRAMVDEKSRFARFRASSTASSGLLEWC
jgi:hypothetical protein